MKILSLINMLAGLIFGLCYFYQFVYIFLYWILKAAKKKKEPVVVENNLAVLICARNESQVIGDLLDCLNKQTYPKDKLTVFVMADNCTDNTAEVSAKHGAKVYERENHELVGKGYALSTLMNHIREDYPEGFDGYVVFDADNILKDDYIEQINRTFCEGYDIVTGYRNSKNYGDNWVSMGYALWFIRESRFLNSVRYMLNTSCAVSGTGFMFSRKLADEMNGWSYFSLTEDIEFSASNIVKGRKVGFSEKAELYDEQPVKFSQSWTQRLRWSKGYLQVIKLYGKQLIKGIFKGSWSCFDFSMNIMPAYALTLITAASNIGLGIIGAILAENPMPAIKSVVELILSGYLLLVFVGLVSIISEWKHIQTPAWKKIASVFVFPIFMFTFIPISIVALFAKVSWTPIAHTRSSKALSGSEFKKMVEAKNSEK